MVSKGKFLKHVLSKEKHRDLDGPIILIIIGLSRCLSSSLFFSSSLEFAFAR